MQEAVVYNKVLGYAVRGFGVFVRLVSTTDSFTTTRQWLYNRRSELVGASGTQANPYDYAYSYDSIGNRLTSSDDFGTATYAANCLNQYTQVTRNQTPQNLTYDADGNLTQDDRFTYSYDDENRLVSVTPLNPYPFNAVVNAYDHRNRRIRKDVWGYHEGDWRYQETHTFVWDGWNIVLEQITNGDQVIHTIEYFWGNDFSGTEQGAGGVGGLLATRIDGVFYIPVYGSNGNIMMYVDGTGTIAAQFDYDPYGRVLVAPNYWENLWNFGFSTKYHDWETDLVAYQLRTYDSLHGRWLGRDIIGEIDCQNLYCFCMNSPVALSDVLGNWIFNSALPPGKGYNSPPDKVSMPLWDDEVKHQKCATPLQLDRDELERVLLSWCPSGTRGWKIKWDVNGVCCRSACRYQARLIANFIYRRVSENRTVYQGLWGNAFSYAGAEYGLGCVDWQCKVSAAFDDAMKNIEERVRCFRAVPRKVVFDIIGMISPDYALLQHNYVEIETWNGHGKVIVDPWPTGGRSFLFKDDSFFWNMISPFYIP